VDHAAQARGRRHVDAVVVLGAEVDGGEVAPLELCGQRRVTAHEGQRAVGVPLGLEDLVALDATELADRAIHRADKGCVGQRACARLERAGEELVEGRVGRRVRVGGLGHVHAVAADEPANEGLREAATLPAGKAPGELRQRLFRQQVLEGDEQGHRSKPRDRKR